MAYTPSKETRRHLRDLYEMRGSYQKVADELNKGRRGNDRFTRYQVRQMLTTKRAAHGEIRDAPVPVRLTEAQQRSLQRKTKVEGRVYEKSYEAYREDERRSEKGIRAIQENINRELRKREAKLEAAMRGGDRAEAVKMREEIRRYQGYNENLRKAQSDAANYQQWKEVRDKVS